MSKFQNNASSVAYTGTAGRLGPLNNGVHYVSASSDCYYLQGGSGVTATTSSNPYFASAAQRYLRIVVGDSSEAYVSFVQRSAGGTGYASAGGD